MSVKARIEIIKRRHDECMRALKNKCHRLGSWFVVTQSMLKELLSMDLGDLSQRLAAEFRSTAVSKNRLKNIEQWPSWFRGVLLCIVFVLVLVLSSFGLWGTPLNDLNALDNEALLHKARYQRMIQEEALLTQRRERLITITARFGEMLELIPAELEIVHVLDQVNAVARESGMQLQSFMPEQEIIEEAYAILPVNIELSGSFDSVGRFLEAMSRLKHLVTMDILLESRKSTSEKLYLIAKLKAYRGEITKGTGSDRNANRDPDVAR